MATKLNLSICLTGALCLLFSGGCDLGTYSSRMADVPSRPAPASNQSDSDSEEDESSGTRIDAAVGEWELDTDATARLTLKVIKKEGLPIDTDAFETAISNATMEFDLRSNGKWTVYEAMAGQESESEGKWTLNGNKIQLNQTHENGVKKKDQMKGTLDGDTMSLTHRNPDLDFEMPVILIRAD